MLLSTAFPGLGVTRDSRHTHTDSFAHDFSSVHTHSSLHSLAVRHRHICVSVHAFCCMQALMPGLGFSLQALSGTDRLCARSSRPGFQALALSLHKLVAAPRYACMHTHVWTCCQVLPGACAHVVSGLHSSLEAFSGLGRRLRLCPPVLPLFSL